MRGDAGVSRRLCAHLRCLKAQSPSSPGMTRGSKRRREEAASILLPHGSCAQLATVTEMSTLATPPALWLSGLHRKEHVQFEDRKTSRPRSPIGVSRLPLSASVGLAAPGYLTESRSGRAGGSWKRRVPGARRTGRWEGVARNLPPWVDSVSPHSHAAGQDSQAAEEEGPFGWEG